MAPASGLNNCIDGSANGRDRKDHGEAGIREGHRSRNAGLTILTHELVCGKF